MRAHDDDLRRGVVEAAVYRGVAPTTNRGKSTDYHGEPIATTGQVTGERSVAVYLTPSEIRCLRVALMRAPFYGQKYIGIRDALQLTLDRLLVEHDTQGQR